MFQTFDNEANPTLAADRLKLVRALMAKAGVDVLLVPRADEYQGEYVPPCAERLKWLTGFSGSAGLAAIGVKTAAVFVDGRYRVQVRAECDDKLFAFPPISQEKVVSWLEEALPKGGVVGFDPWLHTIASIERLKGVLGPKGFSLKPLSRNLVDKAWGKDRPSPPANPVDVHEKRYAGRTSEEKLQEIQERLKQDGQDAVVLTMPDSIAWAFNIRGSDISHNPVVLVYAIVPVKGKADLFLSPKRASKELKAHLSPVARLREPSQLAERMTVLKDGNKRVRLDPAGAAFWFARKLGKKGWVPGTDPCLLLKAVKNATEISGTRRAHQRDGVALARFLAWLDREAPGGGVDEIAAVKRLEEERAQTQALREISFDTISGAGPNGAIVHYRVSEKTNRPLKSGELFLIDSGAQYRDGTTDVTRTISIGTPTDAMRRHFTLVLKGNIAVDTAIFPEGTRGVDLDPFARRALWTAGLDYDHGTGHGVGSYLSVHEGPQSISRSGMVVLQPGMICSNEPGYYKEGSYGIRIENLVLVQPAKAVDDGERKMMSFETLTLAPIDRRLVDEKLLSAEELAWLNDYHARVRQEIGPDLDGETRKWLDAATAPIG